MVKINSNPIPLWGFPRIMKKNSNTKSGKNCLLVGGEPIACFTSVAEDLNSGIPRTNPSDQGES